MDHTTESCIDVQVRSHVVNDTLFLKSYVELKELIAMHSSTGEFGGDLKSDTVTIIGATLDLQEKVRPFRTPTNCYALTFVRRPYDKR